MECDCGDRWQVADNFRVLLSLYYSTDIWDISSWSWRTNTAWFTLFFVLDLLAILSLLFPTIPTPFSHIKLSFNYCDYFDVFLILFHWILLAILSLLFLLQHSFISPYILLFTLDYFDPQILSLNHTWSTCDTFSWLLNIPFSHLKLLF